MKRARGKGLSIFSQTLLLLLASVAVVFVVTVALFAWSPPPRPDFNSLSDIAEALSGRKMPRGRHWRVMTIPRDRAGAVPIVPAPGPDPDDRERRLGVVQRPTAPLPDPDMVSSDVFTARLADRIGVPIEDVRLFFEPDQRSNMPFGRHGDRRVIVRRGEPLFFDTVVAGLRTDGGWRVVRTPPRAWLASWQRRVLMLFGLSLLAVIPFAWFFARALAKPIRRIADAADQMGANPKAPLIVEEGPTELRVTAHALNSMQQRLSAYLAERTNMIGAIAHDLRTPLARIAFRIEGAPDEMREKVQGDIEQMRAMIAATISFVRDTGSVTVVAPVAIDALIEGLAADEREIGRPVVLGRIEAAEVAGDPMALERLFQNLVDNGVVYGGGVEIDVVRVGGEVEIRIADRGPGLPERSLEAMFQPFERGEPSRNRATGGIGLGLSIARAIAQEHGGSLVLANRPGGGLEAICRLPIRS
ncbi:MULTISPECIES: sensor histidine kinase [unclassified Sphingomonas]|uniref:sensor histidine kinase n=1 Tax=unclassified Sphingomonas TaxID=196159 RepID=UPI0006F9493F|nr:MULTISPECIES: HAMP domain-containing sensor histidine kinase [unclassified Sphingomonas]KQX24843.1 histidine kinase [Sphingomonas sp. Root1294]KQY69831.1 histidine kinase [Sphingomonas sp. Root50]KRB93946.1 histidine kinase [Sphingomonas sp. Root720]